MREKFLKLNVVWRSLLVFTFTVILYLMLFASEGITTEILMKGIKTSSFILIFPILNCIFKSKKALD